MPPYSESARDSQSRQLAGELRALQDRLNDTIDHLCDMAAGRGFIDARREGQAATGVLQTEAVWVPSVLRLPLRNAYWKNPGTGAAIGPDTKFYSNYRKGLLQIVQQPSTRGSAESYSLILNYADIDGDMVSIVVDGRALLAQTRAGRARIGLVVEVNGFQHGGLFARCAWKSSPGKWQDRTVEVRSNQTSIASFDIDNYDPAQIQALDIHLLCNPLTRGSIEIRRIGITVIVQPPKSETGPGDGVFEAAP
jgi:hypothetical protein